MATNVLEVIMTDNEHIVMRKFLTEKGSEYVRVSSDCYDGREDGLSGWSSVDVELGGGGMSFTMYFSLGRGETLESDYKEALDQLETVKQACNAAMDELCDQFTDLSEPLPDAPVSE